MENKIIQHNIIQHNIQHPIYPFCYVLFKGDKYKIKKHLDNELDITMGDCEGYACIYKGDIYLYIGNPKDLKTLIHEIVHAVQISLDSVGIDTGCKNTEILAYEIEYLYAETMKFYENNNENILSNSTEEKE